MIRIPQKIRLPLVVGLIVLTLGSGIYIGRKSAKLSAHAPSLPAQTEPAAPSSVPETSPDIPAPASEPESASQEPVSPPTSSASTESPSVAYSSGDIGDAAAKASALTHAGLAENEVTNLYAERDWDDGRLEYEVDFWRGAVEYEYTIDGITGMVLKYKQEDHTIVVTSSGDIGDVAAKTIALDHAGLAENLVTGLQIERDWDDGRLEYEVEFWQGTVEYEYTIDGATGVVLKYEREEHNV